jgi:hypothetical protein
MTVSLAAFAFVATLGASAQSAWLDQAAARVLDLALPPQAYDWSMRWSPFGVRLGREVRWHLSEPGYDAGQRDLEPGVYRRVGWLSHEGRTLSVAACGDDSDVRALAVSATDTELNHEGVIEALGPLGFAAVEISREAAVLTPEMDQTDLSLRQTPARVAWMLTKAGHGEALLVSEHVCTPPGMASAPRCWVRLTLQFGAEDEAPTACPMPGRWGV